jgi:hypothetical protein
LNNNNNNNNRNNNNNNNKDDKELQKTDIFVTAYILMQRYKTFNMGNDITCAMKCNNWIAATLYTLGIRLVSSV